MDFDIILFDYKNHIIFLGENAPDETYKENTISNLGVSFSHEIISIRSKIYSEIGKYKTNEFYHVTVIVDPLFEKFDITITGNLYDLEGNFVDKLSIKELEFEFPITENGIRRLNLYTGTRLNSDVYSVSMGLDNVIVDADI